jgi:hypothetical protein
METCALYTLAGARRKHCLAQSGFAQIGRRPEKGGAARAIFKGAAVLGRVGCFFTSETRNPVDFKVPSPSCRSNGTKRWFEQKKRNRNQSTKAN